MHRLPQFPEKMQEAFRALLSFWQMTCTNAKKVAETYRAYDELPVGSEEREEEWKRAWDAWEATASRQRKRVLLEPLIAMLERERQRQVDAVVAAMKPIRRSAA